MDDELKTDIIDGELIDWSKLSSEELVNLKNKLQKKEQAIVAQIDNLLETDDKI